MAIIASIVILSIATIVYVVYYGQSIQPSSFRSFMVTGDGKTIAIPDVAEVTFGVITQGGKQIADLQKENSQKMNKIINFLKDTGVKTKDINTQNYNLDPRYQYYDCSHPESSVKPCPPPDIIGYNINQTVLIKIRDFDKIGDIMAGIIKNGANTISQLSFAVDDPTVFQNQARAEAIKKAKQKAESIATAGGFKLGRLLSIDESSYAPMPRMYDGYGGGIAKMESAAPTIEPGSQEITANVTLKYEIK
ncbi:MAG: SIMPL domain-containing protein [Patescibacteria group bacterium]